VGAVLVLAQRPETAPQHRRIQPQLQSARLWLLPSRQLHLLRVVLSVSLLARLMLLRLSVLLQQLFVWELEIARFTLELPLAIVLIQTLSHPLRLQIVFDQVLTLL